ncbi:hypothetical protein LXA43DRAFT_947736 [Ganoderma leucocontextum]|nr:hypothetical protein LXA43DRAFT_947736 [Ganoderma leucocontextum]
MLSPREDIRKLEITLRHYEDDYESQAVKTGKLQAEIVQLKATIAYLQQCLEEERAQRKSESAPAEVCFSQPTMTGGALALNTPPMSDRGSISQPFSLEDRIQSLEITVSSLPLPLRPRNATVTYSKKRKIAADRDRSHNRQPSTEEKAGSSNPRKRAKSIVHVLVPPLSPGKRRAFSRALLSTYEDGLVRAGSSSGTMIKRERDDSIQPLAGRQSVEATAHRTQHLRSPSRELSYLDPPIPTRTTNAAQMRSPAPPESSFSVHRSSSLRTGLRNGTSRIQGSGETISRPSGDGPIRDGQASNWQRAIPSPATGSKDPPRVLRPLPRRSAQLRSMVSAPESSATRASADAVDRLCDIPSFDVKVSDKSLLDKTANRAQLSVVLGGPATRTCVSVNHRNLLYPNHEFQPWRPSKPGKPGLFLYPSSEEQWQGDIQTIFVALYMAKYRYVGEYRLTAAEPLSPDEFNALAPAVKHKWAGHVAQTVLFKEIRVRIATRRDKRREATMQEVMTVANDTKNFFRGTVTAEDVLRAYESGDERMHVWRMACVRFDEAFLRDSVGSL